VWAAFGVLVLVGIGGAVAAVVSSTSSGAAPHPCRAVALDRPAVIGYLDPSFPPDSVCKVARSAQKAITDKGLPFTVSADDVNRTVILRADGTDSTHLRRDVSAATRLLRPMSPVLGVETAASPASPPFCGTVPRERMDPSKRAVANALVGLHLGEQDFGYYAESVDMKVTLNVLLIQARVDEGFIRQLARIRLHGAAAAAKQRLLDDRAAYDATLLSAARSLNANDQAAAQRAVPVFHQQRDTSAEDLDALRSALGFADNTCFFTTP
jgi:hypothetical protein